MTESNDMLDSEPMRTVILRGSVVMMRCSVAKGALQNSQESVLRERHFFDNDDNSCDSDSASERERTFT